MRYLIAITGLLVVVGALVFVKYSQISTLIGFGKKTEKEGPPPEIVGSGVSEQKAWQQVLSAVGTVAPVKGVSISNDAPGVVSRIRFESGATVKQGDVLVELDSSVEQAQLASAKVKKDLASVTQRRTEALVQNGVLAKSQLDNDDSQLKSSAADLDLLQAQISRKIVRAPFAGRLGIRNVNVGQYLNPGTPLTVLEAVEGAFVDFSLPQQQAVSVGMHVKVTIEGAPELDSDGVVVAIDPTIDSATRSTKLRASVPNKTAALHPGMFANVSVVLPNESQVVIVPTTAVVHAAYGDSIFVVEDLPEDAGPAKNDKGEDIKLAQQQFVRLGERRGDFVVITDGIKAGQTVVTAGAFKLHNKGHIIIDNDAAPKPEINPHPENH